MLKKEKKKSWHTQQKHHNYYFKLVAKKSKKPSENTTLKNQSNSADTKLRSAMTPHPPPTPQTPPTAQHFFKCPHPLIKSNNKTKTHKPPIALSYSKSFDKRKTTPSSLHSIKNSSLILS